MADISLKIYEPSGTAKDISVSRVQIPAYNGPLTVIKNRAPTSVLLTNGVVRVLDDSGKSIEFLFVQGGIADISENTCTISTECAIHCNNISKEEAQAKIEDEQTSNIEKKFYMMILRNLESNRH